MFKRKTATFLLALFMLLSSLVIPQTTATAFSGWKQNGTTWNYYTNDSKATGWISSGGLWYYLNSNGDMVTGWVSYGGYWYYLNENGGMESGKWITLQGKQYYLYSNGTLAVNTTTPDGYTVGYDGAWNGLYKTTYTTQGQNNSYTVYITESGSKYHRAGCRYLWHSSYSISKNDAISAGYTPCSICRP
ncbi:MAG: hypothetical protein ACM3X7_00890 [Solirubrobacterales bacterium]